MSTDTAPREDLGTVRDAFYSPDPDLSPSERETVFRFSREEDRVSFYTEEAGVGRRLAAHPASDVEAVTVREGDDRPSRRPEAIDEDDHVVGLRGTLPIGALLIQTYARDTSAHAEIVPDTVYYGGEQ